MRVHRAGFTILELLFVAAIIGILGALILPILSRAKERARETNCASNLRQLYAAIDMYCSDTDGWQHPPPDLVSINAYVGNNQIFHCPSEDWIRKYANGSWPLHAWLWPSEDEAPFRISYPYVIEILRIEGHPDFDHLWELIRSKPNTGVVACNWHGAVLQNARGWRSDKFTKTFGPPPEHAGPVIRICFDGHLYVRQHKVGAWQSPDDLFYWPDLW